MVVRAPKDWLDWHSSRTAQECAVRLSLACSSVVPADKKLQALIEETIVSDLIELALHGRRTMERHNKKSASLNGDPLWPASNTPVPDSCNLWSAFGIVVHAIDISVQWEDVDMQPNPYKGRTPKFAGTVVTTSDQKETKIPIGSIVASFFGGVLNQL